MEQQDFEISLNDYRNGVQKVVTDGVESAVEKAKAAAGDKNVGVGGANIAQQCLKAE